MVWKRIFNRQSRSPHEPTDEELLGYMDEGLLVERMTEVEAQLRKSPELRQRLAILIRRRDQGGHTIGEIWRRHRITCASREQLGSYLLGMLEEDQATFIRFHIETTGCRFCAANLQDLMQESQKSNQEVDRRRRRFFESSAGTLRTMSDD